jgi:SAM-dependent methyltransferase
MERAVRRERDRARLFDREAERYDRSRPTYPEAVIDDVLGPSPHGLSVLDVACGTGIAARLMARRGAQVLGVELNAGLAEIAERHGIPTEVAAFETWDPAGRTFDRVTCAQPWHWLDPEVSAEKAASLLRPGGRLCLFWSVGHHPDDLADVLQAAYQRVLPPGSPRVVTGYAANKASDPAADFSVVAEALRGCGHLTEPQTKSFPWSCTYTRDQWLDQLLSHSDHIAPGTRGTKELVRRDRHNHHRQLRWHLPHGVRHHPDLRHPSLTAFRKRVLVVCGSPEHRGPTSSRHRR